MAILTKSALEAKNDLQITTNGNNEITGAILNGIIDDLIDSYEDFIGSYTTAAIAGLGDMTTRQIVYDTDIKAYYYYDGSAWQPFSGRKYKVYTALLTQTGTGAPVATVLENTLGGTPVYARTDVGEYTITLASAWVENKTWTNPPSTSVIDCIRTSANVLTLLTDEADDQLTGFSFEIRVYS